MGKRQFFFHLFFQAFVYIFVHANGDRTIGQKLHKPITFGIDEEKDIFKLDVLILGEDLFGIDHLQHFHQAIVKSVIKDDRFFPKRVLRRDDAVTVSGFGRHLGLIFKELLDFVHFVPIFRSIGNIADHHQMLGIVKNHRIVEGMHFAAIGASVIK